MSGQSSPSNSNMERKKERKTQYGRYAKKGGRRKGEKRRGQKEAGREEGRERRRGGKNTKQVNKWGRCQTAVSTVKGI